MTNRDGPTGVEGDLHLCPWAATYINYMRRLVCNWRSGSFESYQLTKEDWCCCIACCKSIVAVYYPRPSNVRLYSIDNGLVLLATIPVALPNGIAIPDVFINETFVVLSRGNVILVYRIAEGFSLYKSIVGAEGGISIADNIVPFVENDRRIYVKIVTDEIVWLESEAMFVVDLAANTYRVLPDTFRCLRFDEKQIYAANHVVSVYNLAGDKLYHLEIYNVADMWVEEDYVVVLLGSEEQYLQVWRLSTRTELRSIPVEREPCVCFGPDSLMVLEFGERLLKLSCISIEKNVIHWVYENSFCRELVIHPEVRFLCDKFVFIRPSHTKDENFLLVDSKSGCVLYDSVMPPSLNPPGYIYHLSDESFITAESSTIHIRRYL